MSSPPVQGIWVKLGRETLSGLHEKKGRRPREKSPGGGKKPGRFPEKT
jgi:hypothetical protein